MNRALPLNYQHLQRPIACQDIENASLIFSFSLLLLRCDAIIVMELGFRSENPRNMMKSCVTFAHADNEKENLSNERSSRTFSRFLINMTKEAETPRERKRDERNHSKWNENVCRFVWCACAREWFEKWLHWVWVSVWMMSERVYKLIQRWFGCMKKVFIIEIANVCVVTPLRSRKHTEYRSTYRSWLWEHGIFVVKREFGPFSHFTNQFLFMCILLDSLVVVCVCVSNVHRNHHISLTSISPLADQHSSPSIECLNCDKPQRNACLPEN